MVIQQILGREILDSRGNPTVEATVVTQKGMRGCAACPAGASVGKFEARELRDGGSRMGGMGVSRAVEQVRGELAAALAGKEWNSLAELDGALCRVQGGNGNPMGANARLALSMAAARALAEEASLPLYEYLGGKRSLPVPMMNILNGGVHAANPLDIQEFMVVPMGAPSAAEAVWMGAEIYKALGVRLKAKGLATLVGDEGGFAPAFAHEEQALEEILAAIRDAGAEDRVRISLDAAASEWYVGNGVYRLPKKGVEYTRAQLVARWLELTRDWPLLSIEDPMGEEDPEGWQMLRAECPALLVGDDLLVTHPDRIRWAAGQKLCGALLLKPNQIGTVTQAIQAARTAREAGMQVIASHRSGDTEDAFITDLAVALGAEFLKAGAPCRGERTAKYNRLLRICEGE